MPTVNQVADWIIKFRADTGAPVDPMSLQKLLFYAQAFCFAQHGEPLFDADFEAWRHGPVVRQIWGAHAYVENDAGVIVPHKDVWPPQIDGESEACLKDAVQFFSRLNAVRLSHATHNEDPWLSARGKREWYENSSEPIPRNHIRTYYAELIADGEDALSRHEALDVVPEPRIGIYYQAGICVRRMTRHPLYRMDWAEALLSPVAPDPDMPQQLFAPILRREFVAASDL